jgi:nitrogen-specific signal transduction histidine kinase/CheY-like chemotaxis protein
LNKAESEKIALNNQLSRAQKMESLAFLASGVAHDLNNIIGPMIAYPELIKMNLPPDSPVIAQVEKIEQSAQKAADVVQDLIAMSRRGQYEMVDVNLNELVKEALESSEIKEAQSQTQNVKIMLSPDETLPELAGSRTHLSKVIRSLIVNAINAVPNGGDVTIETTSKHCDELLLGFSNIEEGNYAILTVTDTGEGLDEKDRKRIFEPFYSKKQLGRTGSGLGLAIAYGVIKDHNGYIDIQSEKCAGTTFIIYLPIQKAVTLEETKLIVDIRGSEKILVVDDVEEQRELAATTLSSLGYKVDVAANGQDALEYCKENNPDVVIIDMILTDGYDGLDTYREISKFRPGLKAVLVSGFDSTGRVEEAKKLGAGKFIKKPYSMQILGKAIREVLAAEPAKPEKTEATV